MDSKINYRKVASIIQKIEPSLVDEYKEYWQTIVPITHYEYFLRWVFAYLSVRTRWQENVKHFEALRDMGEDFSYSRLYKALEKNHVGMVETRRKGIWWLYNSFKRNPDVWYPQFGESHHQCRQRLAKMAYGLGITKVSFVLEMTFPDDCEVVCLDSRIKSLYGFDGKTHVSDKDYLKMENHWVGQCKLKGIPSPIARHIVWDKIQKQASTRYWSHVFEGAGCQKPVLK